jgi:hypothetical protein
MGIKLGRLAIIFLIAGLVGGCAKRPASITALIVSPDKYREIDCTRLEIQLSDAKIELDKVSAMQSSKSNGDATSVALFGIPFSFFTGDFEKDVAKWKGEIVAIERAKENACPA